MRDKTSIILPYLLQSFVASKLSNLVEVITYKGVVVTRLVFTGKKKQRGFVVSKKLKKGLGSSYRELEKLGQEIFEELIEGIIKPAKTKLK